MARRAERILEVRAEARGDREKARELEGATQGEVVYHAREGTILLVLELPCDGPLLGAARDAIETIEALLGDQLLLLQLNAEELVRRDGKLVRRARAERPALDDLTRRAFRHLDRQRRDATRN